MGVLDDEVFVDIVGQEIGRSLAAFRDCDFTAGLKPADLPEIVRYGLGSVS